MITRHILFSLAVLLCGQSGIADDSDALPGARRKVYKTIGDVELAVHIFEPEGHQASDRRPVAVFFFGGAWKGGSVQQFAPHCEYLASRGVVAMAADYRVQSRHQTTPFDCVKDGKSAIRWVRENAARLGIDPNRIAAGGGSAGGHVAAATATIEGLNSDGDNLGISAVPNALLLFNPVYDNGPDGYGYDRVGDRYKEISPFHNIREGIPPAIVFLGTNDKLIPVSTAEEFQRRMQAVGSRSELRLYEDQPHGFFNYRDTQKSDTPNYYEETVREMDEFLVSLGYLEDRPSRPPNIVYIMSDELAYYEVSYMGHSLLQTPRIDRMAAEGIRFTQALAGSPVCAPLRCNLLTGKHAGHASVRANGGGTPLRAEEATIASMLKEIGYATGGFGKWGCGGRDSTGVPEKHGFDVFFGYYDQVHAHSYFPPYLIRNSEEVPLAGNIGGRSGQTYSHYEIMREGLQFIRDHQQGPFFCYFPITPTHPLFDIPADDSAWELYQDVNWINDPEVPQDVKNYAAMTSMVDRNVGEVLDLLAELGLDDSTLVFFAGDNGGYERFKSEEHPHGYFGPNVNPKTGVAFRGGKGNLYEGGLRIPSIARWPGHIDAGQKSDLVWYHPDVLPTIAEVTGATPPPDIDGLSILPELIGSERAGRHQELHGMLYWEFNGKTAVRKENWKAIQTKPKADWELYDLSTDISEEHNVAVQHPDLLAMMKEFATASHTPVREGTFTTRQRHERDRQAKWGTSQQDTN